MSRDDYPYRLAGYAPSVPEVPAFVMPIFMHNEQLFHQTINIHGHVEDFLPIDEHFVERIRTSDGNVDVDLDSEAIDKYVPAVYGFRDANGKLFFHNQRALARYLMSTSLDFLERPFLYAKVYDFAVNHPGPGMPRDSWSEKLVNESISVKLDGGYWDADDEEDFRWYAHVAAFFNQNPDLEKGRLLAAGADGEALACGLIQQLPAGSIGSVVFLGNETLNYTPSTESAYLLETQRAYAEQIKVFDCISARSTAALSLSLQGDNIFEAVAARTSPGYQAWRRANPEDVATVQVSARADSQVLMARSVRHPSSAISDDEDD